MKRMNNALMNAVSFSGAWLFGMVACGLGCGSVTRSDSLTSGQTNAWRLFKDDAAAQRLRLVVDFDDVYDAREKGTDKCVFEVGAGDEIIQQRVHCTWAHTQGGAFSWPPEKDCDYLPLHIEARSQCGDASIFEAREFYLIPECARSNVEGGQREIPMKSTLYELLKSVGVQVPEHRFVMLDFNPGDGYPIPAHHVLFLQPAQEKGEPYTGRIAPTELNYEAMMKTLMAMAWISDYDHIFWNTPLKNAALVQTQRGVEPVLYDLGMREETGEVTEFVRITAGVLKNSLSDAPARNQVYLQWIRQFQRSMSASCLRDSSCDADLKNLWAKWRIEFSDATRLAMMHLQTNDSEETAWHHVEPGDKHRAIEQLNVFIKVMDDRSYALPVVVMSRAQAFESSSNDASPVGEIPRGAVVALDPSQGVKNERMAVSTFTVQERSGPMFVLRDKPVWVQKNAVYIPGR